MRCPDCGNEKPPEEFPRNRNTKTGRATYCKPCHNARGKQSKTRLYGGSRHYHLKQKYGIGADDVDRMIAEQGGVCAVCKRKPAIQVDHDHRSKRVRGILCDGCNGGLGLFDDDPAAIRRAIDYLKRSKDQMT